MKESDLGNLTEEEKGGKRFLKPRLLICLFLLIVIAAGLGFYLYKRRKEAPSYVSGYRLVNAKVSRSAPIMIHLPPEINKQKAKKGIAFHPKIKGGWLQTSNKKELIFKPREKLKRGHYYSVQLVISEPERVKMEAEFLAVEDPKISAVFPKEETEASEYSEISIVFNRPMVPLSTLQKMEEEVPVEISPKTKGRFKWTDTRTLQFIPEEHLKRSTRYTVKIKSGLTSVDGLPVKGKKVKFETRNLRYKGLHRGKTVYDQPATVKFNQPVDVGKTVQEITLKDLTDQKKVPFVTKCASSEKGSFFKKRLLGLTKTYNFLLGSIAETSPKLGFLEKIRGKKTGCSTLKIYNKKDKFGRSRLWDFDHNYQLSIKKAYPLEGEINLGQRRAVPIRVTSPIKGMRAESARSRQASLGLFDPEGKLWIEFYEDIDLNRSRITVDKSEKIGYGKKCEPEEGVVKSSSCSKVKDQRKIYVTFQEEKVGLEEEIEILFKKIVTKDGLVLNRNPLSKNIISYPEFRVVKTSPRTEEKKAPLTSLVLCSTTPVLRPEKKDYSDFFNSNLDYEINYWGRSRRVRRKRGEVCRRGEFHTDLSYGLMPVSNYELGLSLKDVFGQKTHKSLTLKTEEMPSRHLDLYRFQPNYNVTSPEKTKLTYAAKNMDYVEVKICKVAPLTLLRFLEEEPSRYASLPARYCQESATDTIRLPKKYWIKNYFQLNLEDYFRERIGHYVITLSHPQYRSRHKENRPIHERTFVTVTDLSVASKRIQPERLSPGDKSLLSPTNFKEVKNLYLVTDLHSLQPVPEAKVTLYQRETSNPLSFKKASRYLTDEKGVARADVSYNLRGAVVRKGKDSTLIPYFRSKLNYAPRASGARKVFLYTDKPIYQPGQKVHVRGLYRLGYDGSYQIYRGKSVPLTVHNSKDDEILSRKLNVNQFGTFNTDFILSQDAPLGKYRVCAFGSQCRSIDLEEYVPAPFKVQATPDQEEYISKEEANIKIDADYYFGVPLQGGEVEYTLSSQDYHFDRYQDGRFSFGRPWYYRRSHSYGEKFLLRGKTDLDKKGGAKVSHLLDTKQLFKPEQRESKILVLNTTVKNNQGQSVSKQESFILHQGNFYLGLDLDKSFLGKNEKTTLHLKSVDTEGEPRSLNRGEVKIFKTDWIYNKRLEATGGYSYQWEKKRNLVEKFSFATNKEGDFSHPVRLKKEGRYEIEAAAEDKRGNRIENTQTAYVYGRGQVTVKPTTDTTLNLEAEKARIDVGEEGKVVIKSPYKKAKALIAIERGKVFDYKIKEIEGNISTFTFPVKESYSPNVFVSVLLFSNKPGIKFGTKEFQVEKKRESLEVEISTDKNFYLPGEEVSLHVSTKGWQGQPKRSELSLAVVDLSVLALKGNPKKNPLIFFYNGFPLAVSTSSNLKNILVEKDISTKGGGGAPEEVLAQKKRGVFKETAFWQAKVRTDKQGEADLSFTLPDNLTTWQVEGVGLTKDLKLGTDYKEFTTKKDLMVVPLKPRFVVPGDLFRIGAKIFNQTEKRRRIEASFQSPSLSLKGKGERSIRVGANKEKTIYFKLKAPSNIERGVHTFKLRVETKGKRDVVEKGIEITPNQTYEVTATSNYTSAPTREEYVFLPKEVVKEKGNLSFKGSATLAMFLSDALNQLIRFPYGCSEQVASRLQAIAVVKKGLGVPNLSQKLELEKIKRDGKKYSLSEAVEVGLNKIYNQQKANGGFSYWEGGKPNFHLTLHIVQSLNTLAEAGFEINENSRKRATDYLHKKITTDPRLYEDKNTLILTAYTLLETPGFQKRSFLKEKIKRISLDETFIKGSISNTSLAHLALVLTGRFPSRLKNKVFDQLDSRIEIDARGAFLPINENHLWSAYETATRNTALYLKAQTEDKRKGPVLDKTIRWILNSRSKKGGWGSTQNSLAVIDALTHFLSWQRETESHFKMSLLVNEKKKGEKEFKKENILSQFRKKIDLENLKFNQINKIKILKKNLSRVVNNFYYDLALKYYFPLKNTPARNEGFSIERNIYKKKDFKNKKSLQKAKVGDILRVHLKIIVPETRHHMTVEDFIPAGTEIVKLDLATEQKSLSLQKTKVENRNLRPDFKELRDDRVFLYKKKVRPGVYEFDYWVRAIVPGQFRHLPAKVEEMYFPENFGRSRGSIFRIK